MATVAALAAGVLVFVLSHGASLLLPLAQVPRVGWRLLRQPPPSPLIVLVPPTGVVTPAMQCEQLPRASGAASTRPGNTPRCCRVADADLNDDSAAREVAASAGTDTGDPRSQWRVLLVTLLHGPTWRRGSEFGDASWDNKLRYAQRHGYELADGSGLVNASRHPAWSKALIVSHYLHTRRDVDVVAFFDADALFMRSDVPLVQYLHPTLDHVVMGTDWNGANSGVFLVRNTLWSRTFFASMWGVGPSPKHCGMWDQYAWHVRLNVNTKCDVRGVASAAEVADARCHVRLVPQRVLNANVAFAFSVKSRVIEGGYRHGDLLVHLASNTQMFGWHRAKHPLFLALAREASTTMSWGGAEATL